MAGEKEAKLRLGSFHLATDPETGKPFVLGRGAMGVTYKAIQSPLNRPVALKVITESLIDDEDSKERFLREARALASLYHNNIVTIYDFGEEDETFFYAMEFIDGKTLADVILKEGPLEIGDALRITAQVANALHAAEEKGLVHRDIKPANIMLRKTRENPLHVTVIDFGLVKALNPDDSLYGSIGGFKGTPVFSSPEQLEEHTLDIRSDIYSLGVTLWFTLTGKPPFAVKGIASVIQAHLSQAPPLENLEHHPPCVRDLLARMLEKEPEKRQQSAGELHQELKNCLAEIPADQPESSDAPSPPPVEKETSATGKGLEPEPQAQAEATPEPESEPGARAEREENADAVPVAAANESAESATVAGFDPFVTLRPPGAATPEARPETPEAPAPAATPDRATTPPAESAVTPNRLPMVASIGVAVVIAVLGYFVFQHFTGEGNENPSPPTPAGSSNSEIALAAASEAWAGRDYPSVRAHIAALEKENPDSVNLGDDATALFERISATLGSSALPAELEAGSPAQLDAWKETVAFIAKSGNAGAAELLDGYPWQWLRRRALAGDSNAASSIVAALLAGELGASPGELASWKTVVERSAGNGNKDAESLLPAYPWKLLRNRVLDARDAGDDLAAETALRDLLAQESAGQRIAGDAELLDIAIAVFLPPSEDMAPVIDAVKTGGNREALGKLIDWLQPGDTETAHALFKKWADLENVSDKEAIEVSLRIADSTDSEAKRDLAVLSLTQIFAVLERQSYEDEEPALRKLRDLQPLLVDASKFTDSAKSLLAKIARHVDRDADHADRALALYLDIDEENRPPHYHNSVGMLYGAGAGDVKDPLAKAVAEFKKGADTDDLCQYALAECYLLGKGVETDPEKGFELIRKLAEGENMPPEVYHLYARCHDSKSNFEIAGLKKDDAEAAAAYRKAFDAYRRLVDSAEKHAAGRPADLLSPRLRHAYTDLGSMYLLGEGTEINPVEAMPLFEKGMEADDAESMFLWAIVYIVDTPEWTHIRELLKGTNWESSAGKRSTAREVLKKAADKGYPPAERVLAQLQ